MISLTIIPKKKSSNSINRAVFVPYNFLKVQKEGSIINAFDDAQKKTMALCCKQDKQIITFEQNVEDAKKLAQTKGLIF